MVPAIDIVDSTWICARPTVVAAVVAEPANWRRWWPRLELAVDEWRGDKGVRWTVRPCEGGAIQRAFARRRDTVTGSMEIWLEPAFDGVVAHFFLRLDPTSGRPLGRRRGERLTRAYRTRAKQVFWSLGDELDPGRIARVRAPRQVASPE